MAATPGAECLFPTPRSGSKRPYVGSLKKICASTLKRAKVDYFPVYHLRHTFATRLSAGGVAEHLVTPMPRQADSQVFKRYSHAKLNMMREVLQQLDRQADERAGTFDTPSSTDDFWAHFLAHLVTQITPA